MARYKEYNEIRLLEKAIKYFWLHGYNATSLASLCKTMRINKFTFYAEFESKENLLIRSMKHYYSSSYRVCLEQLRSDHDILGFFKKILNSNDQNHCGCYILSITAELGNSIPSATSILRDYIEALGEVLKEIATNSDPIADSSEIEQKVQQLLAVFTSVPLMRSIRSLDECYDHVRNMLLLMNMNPLPDHAQTS